MTTKKTRREEMNERARERRVGGAAIAYHPQMTRPHTACGQAILMNIFVRKDVCAYPHVRKGNIISDD